MPWSLGQVTNRPSDPLQQTPPNCALCLVPRPSPDAYGYNWCEAITMRKVEQIEQQIRELSAGEFSELREWVLEQDWKGWDAQVGSDIRSGKLDKVIAEADADYKAG